MNTKIARVIAIFGSMIILCFGLSANAQIPPPDSLAKKTLNDFQKIINQENYKLFGFKSPNEISNLSLGSVPVNVYMIRLDSLRKFEGGDGKNLLVNNTQIIYPVYSNNNIVSAIKMEYGKNKWAVVGFGGADVINYHEKAIRNFNLPENNKSFIVRIPSLNIYLSGVENNNINVQLLGEREVGKLQPNVVTTLEDALTKIKPIADIYNGLPL